jgi:4-hydroxy-tetrahydrodipicolinate reductase
MTLRITLAGCTGWVGRALVAAIVKADDLALAAGVARSAAGRDVGEAAGLERIGVAVAGSIEEALQAPSDVLVDYTKPAAVKGNTLAALAAGRHVVVGTSGLTADDYAEIDAAAREAGRGVLAAGNFSITATLMRRFALEAARYVPDVEIIDYASPAKVDTPSGTGRELAELLGAVRGESSAKPVGELTGVRETRGGAIGAPRAVQVHSVRMPSYLLSCEVLFGADNERLAIRHDAGTSAAPYVAGTLLAARRVSSFTGLRRGLDAVMG